MPSRGSISKLASGRYRARYTDPTTGKERARHFDKKAEAQTFLEHTLGDIAKGQYVDPASGRKLFGEYAREWAKHQAHRGSTAVQLDAHLRRHIEPFFGHRPIGSITRSELKAWVTGRSDELAPATVNVVATWVRSILNAAVDDKIVASSPFHKIALPGVDHAPLVPITTEQMLQLVDLMPNRYRAAVITVAGTGLRQGELFGLTPDRIDFLRRSLRVDRQLVTLPKQAPTFGPPKSKASFRTVPLPDVVLEALAEHMRQYQPGDLGLVFTAPSGKPVRRSTFAAKWAPAARSLGLPERTGMHALRHFYASLLIEQGESVKTVQARLGHASANETLNTYGHLWPDSDERTRSAVDDVFRKAASTPAAEQR